MRNVLSWAIVLAGSLTFDGNTRGDAYQTLGNVVAKHLNKGKRQHWGVAAVGLTLVRTMRPGSGDENSYNTVTES